MRELLNEFTFDQSSTVGMESEFHRSDALRIRGGPGALGEPLGPNDLKLSGPGKEYLAARRLAQDNGLLFTSTRNRNRQLALPIALMSHGSIS